MDDSFLEKMCNFFHNIRNIIHKSLRLKGRGKSHKKAYVNETGKDGSKAQNIVDELYRKKHPNKLDIINNLSPDEVTIPLVLIVSTMLIMIILSGFFSLISYGNGRDYARVKNAFYITIDNQYVALPVSSNRYVLLEAEIKDSSITIHTQKQQFVENDKQVELQRFTETVILDTNGNVFSKHKVEEGVNEVLELFF